MKMKNWWLLVVMFIVASDAYAAIITQTGSWDLSEDIVVTTPLNYAHNEMDSVLFSQFDPALGDLIGVEFLRVSGVSNSRLHARNLSQQLGNFNYSNFHVVGYAAGVGLWYPTLDEKVFFGTGSSGAISLEPLQGWTLVAGGGVDEEGSYMQYYSGEELDLFIGYDTLNMSPRIEVGFNVSNISPDIEALFEINYAYSYAISYVYEPVPEPAPLLGDLNGDGWVGQFDLDIVLSEWGNSAPLTDPRADPSGDGFVGQFDLDYILADWGEGTMPTAPVPEPATLSLLALGSLALVRPWRR